MKKIIYFATGNKHKLEEAQDLFKHQLTDWELKSIDVDILEIQADNLEDVAEFKVDYISKKFNDPFFIEDAGFFVDDTCHGFPGVYSSYVMKTVGYNGIINIIGENIKRNAHFESVIGFYDSSKKTHLFKGQNDGFVTSKPRGTSGFGFDPIFESFDTPGKTFAELEIGEKNKISHRRRALMKLISFLKSF
jgi:XTP/dITP diphosphohydrolase